MGLGVLRDRVMEHVPGRFVTTLFCSRPLSATTDSLKGTTRYFDDPDRPQIAREEQLGRLKCDTSGPQPIILVPQPSDDPNDPLV